MPEVTSPIEMSGPQTGSVGPVDHVNGTRQEVAALVQAVAALGTTSSSSVTTAPSTEGKCATESTGEDAVSLPPSPPDSGDTTPRLRIDPCPPRLRSLIPPPNFGAVDCKSIYRSSFPQDRNLDMVKALKIKAVLILVSTEPSEAYKHWFRTSRIVGLKVDIAPNKNGEVATTMDSIFEALLFIVKNHRHPVYIHCNQGRHRTGCVVACLRKLQDYMSLAEILDEYETYASPKARPGDTEFIKSFDPAKFISYADSRGFFYSLHFPHAMHNDSVITNNNFLLARGLGSDMSSESDDSSVDGVSGDDELSSLGGSSADNDDDNLEMKVTGRHTRSSSTEAQNGDAETRDGDAPDLDGQVRARGRVDVRAELERPSRAGPVRRRHSHPQHESSIPSLLDDLELE